MISWQQQPTVLIVMISSKERSSLMRVALVEGANEIEIEPSIKSLSSAFLNEME